MIAIIPAKGNSERIPRKNLSPIMGRPLLSWTIENLQKTQQIDFIYVSTDDDEIAETATHEGARVISRPTHLAKSSTPMRPVIQHAITWLNIDKLTSGHEEILIVFPTAPLLKAKTIASAFELLNKNNSRASRCVFSCTRYGHPIERSFVIRSGVPVLSFPDEDLKKQTQTFPTRYHDAGTFYLGTKEFFMSDQTVLSEHGIPFEIQACDGLDVDWPEDLVILEALMKHALTLGH